MSMNDEETKADEIIILRRSTGGEEGGHHGGVWKIAYADFMTAMMAFFLVMWLINSTDKQTLTQVATYFNPLRLTDKAPSARGLHQSEAGAPATDHLSGSPKQKPGQTKSDGTTQGKADAATTKNGDEALFRDPYGTLEKLASQDDDGQRRAEPPGRRGGEAYRDPFEPAFRRSAQPDAHESGQKLPPPPAPSAQGAEANAGEAAIAPSTNPPLIKEPEAPKATTDQSAERTIATRLEAEIKHVIARARPGTVPHIEVTVTEEGVLISLTDDYDFGMFAIASAEPRPAMVVVMEKLGKVLAGQSERLVVRGHTDGRPYKSGTYDNWRLSTARAHMAYYMLVRGGIDEKRFERVEGHADRNLKLPGDPDAAQNRRIEILLRKAKP